MGPSRPGWEPIGPRANELAIIKGEEMSKQGESKRAGDQQPRELGGNICFMAQALPRKPKQAERRRLRQALTC